MNFSANNRIYGHDADIDTFHQSLLKGKLHHAWLLSGPQGIGKASIAYKLAKELLVAKSNLNTDKLIDSNSHPDLFVLESEQDLNTSTSQEIKIDQVRKLLEFLHKTAALSKYKVIIIDSIDNLNNNASNALLKALEEPRNNTIFLCISHQIWSVPATIKSRCMILKFKPLSLSDFTNALVGNVDENIDIISLYKVSCGSLHIAYKLIKDDKFHYLMKKVKNLIAAFPQIDLAELLKLKKELSNNEMWYYFKCTILNLQMDKLKELIKSNTNIKNFIEWHSQTTKILNDQSIYNLDKENVALNVFSQK